jgi:hypothetical protein
MNKLLFKKRDILPRESINADKILANMISARYFQVSNDRLRKEIKIKQNTRNLVNNRERLLYYVNTTTTPALKSRLTDDLYNMNKKIDTNIFNLYVLGKRDNII